MNVSDDVAHKYGKAVNRTDYKGLAKVCNPPQMIERGDEGNIGRFILIYCNVTNVSANYLVGISNQQKNNNEQYFGNGN